MDFNSAQKSYIWLDSFAALSSEKISVLIKHFGAAKELVKNFIKEKEFIITITGEKLYNIMAQNLSSAYLEPFLKNIASKNINVITAEDENYPKALAEFDDRPYLLYTLGDVSLLRSPMITVVGSRKCTRYGYEQTEKIVKGLCGYGFTIVSGLAEGIDTAANKAALEAGKTIAVLAGGFDNVYPDSNRGLFEKIAEKGLIISQYYPSTVTLPYMFPLRNRIMAALGCATVITEAGEKSGALITANLALEMGKELFIMPGNVNSPSSKGSNNMLKQMQGAIITCYEDILNGLGIEAVAEEENPVCGSDLSPDENVIYNIVNAEEEHVDDIAAKSGFDIKKVNRLLTILEIKGLVKRLPQNRFGV
jgi:DNA processing protein